MRLIEVMQTEIAHQDVPFELFSMEALFPHPTEMEEALAMKASTDPDTMYMHEAMKQKDSREFRKAMVKEVEDQMNQGVLVLTKRSKVPKGATLLPAVWQMQWKQHQSTTHQKVEGKGQH